MKALAWLADGPGNARRGQLKPNVEYSRGRSDQRVQV